MEQSKESTMQNNNSGYEGKMSPLRVKNFGAREFNDDKKDTTKFYSNDNNNSEKIIVCSVINSSRPEGDDSL